MTQATKPLINSGDSITHPLEHVRVTLLCVRPGHAYRVVVAHLSTGAETDLSQSYPTEAEAREVARGWCRIFATSARVVDVVDALAELARIEVAALPEPVVDEPAGGGA